jgi:hypothetical protein
LSTRRVKEFFATILRAEIFSEKDIWRVMSFTLWSAPTTYRSPQRDRVGR